MANLWPGFQVVYKNVDSTQQTADVATFNLLGIRYVRSNQTLDTYFCDQGFLVDWGPSFGGSINSTAQLQAYHDHILSEAALWVATGRQLWSFEIGNELESQIDGTNVTIQSLHNMIRQTAADVKAAYPGIGLISYHFYDRYQGGGLPGNQYGTFQEFIVNGKGAIDLLGIHLYGYIPANLPQIGGYPGIERIMQTFGDACYISEFNLDGVGGNADTILPAVGRECMDLYYRNFVLPFIGQYNSKAMVYLWDGNSGDASFSLRNPGQTTYRSHMSSFFSNSYGPRTLVT